VIDESPRKVRFMQKWLPVGYRVDDFEIHTYREDGSELATNLSAKRALLSRAEAFEFLLFQYTTTNRPNSLEPHPVRELLPSDLHLIIPRNQHHREAYLNIDERGTVTGVRLEGAAGDPSDAFIEKAIRTVYFFPALAFGEPVESEVTFTLGALIR
jgi:hypothetical protein